MSRKPAKLLRSVPMAGMPIKVRYVGDDELEGKYGDYDGDQRVIRIHKSIKGTPLYVKILRHEMRHAALDMAGLSYCEKMEEEAVVRCLDNLFDPAWAWVVARL